MKKKISATLMAFLLVLQVISSGLLMPASVFAETNNNAVTTNAGTGTDADSQDITKNSQEATNNLQETAQTEEANKQIEQQAKQAVDSLFTNNNYTALAKNVTDWRINSVEATVNKVTSEQVKKDLQDKIELARAFVAVNALFTNDQQNLADGITEDSISTVKNTITALIASSGKNVLLDLVKKATSLMENIKENDVGANNNSDKVNKSTSSVKSKKYKVTTNKLRTLSVDDNTMNQYITSVVLWPSFEDAESGWKGITESENKIKNINIDDNFAITVKFAIGKNELKAGDTLTYQLPKQAVVSATSEENKISGDNGVFGTYTISDSGLITFKFNENVQKGADNAGFTFESKVGNIKTEEDKTLVFPSPDISKTTFTLNIPDKKPTGDLTATKENSDYDKLNDVVTYTMEFNKEASVLKGFVLTDSLPTGVKYKSIKVETKTFNPITGEFASSYQDNTSSFDINPNEDKTLIIVKNKTDLTTLENVKYKITMVVSVDDGVTSIPKNTYNVSKTPNSGNLTTESATTKSEIPIAKEVPLLKTYSYNASNQTITWRVWYNLNKKEISQDKAIIKDTISDNQQFIEDSVKYYKVDDSVSSSNAGMSTRLSELTSVFDNATFENKTMTIKANRNLAAEKYAIEYQTKIIDPVTDRNQIATNKVEASNTTLTSTKTVKLVAGYGYKEKTDIDYSNKTVQWGIKLRTDTALPDANYPVTKIEDTLGNGLTLQTDSFEFENLTWTDPANNNNNNYNVTELFPDGTVIANGNGTYTLSSSALVQNGQDFTLNFRNGVKIPQGLTIKYQTKYDEKKLDNYVAKNSAKIFNGETEIKDFGTKTFPVTGQNNEAQKGIVKTSKYDYAKKEIIWTVDINYNQNKLYNVTITDELSGDHSYTGDLKVNKLKINKDGSKTLSDPINGYTLKSDNQVLNSKGDLKSKKKFDLELSSIDSAVRIEYRTKFDTDRIGPVSDYDNTASWKASESDTEEPTEKGKIDTPQHPLIEYADELINKKNVSTTGRQLNWQIWVNRSQSIFKNDVTLTDTPPDQSIIDDSIELIPYSPNESNPIASAGTVIKADVNGEFKIEGNTVATIDTEKLSENILVIKFNVGLNQPYLVKYSTKYIGDEKDISVTNSASLSNKTITTSNDQSSGNKSIKLQRSMAWAYNKNVKAHLVVNKTLNLKTNDVELEKLKDISFSLYDENAEAKVAQDQTTDSNGQLTFNDLPEGFYLLVENNINSDYQPFGDTTVNGKRGQLIEVSTKTEKYKSGTIEEGKVTYNAKNYKNGDRVCTQGTILVKNQSGKAIQNATVKITDSDNEVEKTYTTNENGEVTLTQEDITEYADGKHNLVIEYKKTSETIKKFTFSGKENCKILVNLDTTCVEDGTLKVVENINGVEAEVTDYNAKVVKVSDNAEVENAIENGKIKKEYLTSDYKLIIEKNNYKTEEINLNKDQLEDCTFKIVIEKCDDLTISFPANLSEEYTSKATFKIIDNTGNEIVKNLKINKDNKIILTDEEQEKLTSNKKYKLVQETTVDGYKDIESDEFTFLTDGCLASIIIKKVDCIDLTINYTGPSNSTATFDLYKVEKDADGKEISAKLYSDLKIENGKVIVKDNDGKVVKTLDAGNYKLVQTKATSGYYKAADTKFTISTDKCLGKITVKNDPIPPTPTPTCPIEFNVVDSKTNNGIGGATFEVKQNGVTVETVTSDASGKVSLPELPVGDYELVQTTTKTGYEFSKDPIPFSVKNDNGTCTVTISTVENDPTICPVDITVIDSDSTNVKVAGATFTIKDKDGKVIVDNDNVTSDKDGNIKVNGLVSGDYILVQTSVPSGYIKSADVSFTVKVKEDGSCENTVVVVKNVPKQCDVTFINKDEKTGKVVKGSSTFILKDKDNKTVTTVTSDSNGKLTVSKLKPGTYKLVQQNAPSGYKKQSKTITFTVKKGECVSNITIENTKVEKPKEPTKGNTDSDKTPGNNNSPGKNDDKPKNNSNNETTFKVTDKNNSNKFKDHEYKLVDKNGKTVASGLKVNKDGNIVVKGLPDGDYHLVKLPQTGTQAPLYAGLMGMTLIALGGYVIYRGRKKKTI